MIRFLLGPAGSGKTFRCLAEARRDLAARPSGPPLLLIAPKQSTFQIERQLLADPSLCGYTRLQILSFERLAYFLFEQCGKLPPDLLAEEGRIMVLRALLAAKRDQLKVFRASARLTGFAQQLAELLSELQRNQLTPDSLAELAARVRAPEGLASKLQDLGGLLQDYIRWLETHHLQDADRLLAAAANLLHSNADRLPKIEKLWVDGFAELSPQELDLLATLLPHCRQATITFCLDQVQKPSWLSARSLPWRNFEDCRKRIETFASILVEELPRDPHQSRFSQSPALAYLERSWDEPSRPPAPVPQPKLPTPAQRRRGKPDSSLQLSLPGWDDWIPQPAPSGSAPQPASSGAPPPGAVQSALRVVRCSDPDGEATVAAREILAHVRSGGRYRDVTVLVRKLELYHDSLQRVFSRYEIPFFMDRRESVAHHPLAELTRSALRTVLSQWKHDEWFAALKTGLVPSSETEIDELENEALARGWKGDVWHQPLQLHPPPGSVEPTEGLRRLEERLERLRQRLLPPFQRLALAVGQWQNKLTGAALADAIQEFWQSLEVEAQIQQWARADDRPSNSVHLTVWDQLNQWLDDIRLAFSKDSLSLREWIPIVESGLASLTVGAIPPALDQVLIGSIERSRNPELDVAIVLGLNETIFPSAPAPLPLLTDNDRAELERHDLLLAASPRLALSRERFYAYLAFTRARRRLVLTSALYDSAGAPLNGSPFLGRIQELFPELQFETAPRSIDWQSSEHPSELIPSLLALGGLPSVPDGAASPGYGLAGLPAVTATLERLSLLGAVQAEQKLHPTLAAGLYGTPIRVSISRLEEFAACPFKFFVNSGLRAEERKRFELDVREQGSFQHEVLAEFHRQLRRENKRWRDLTPAQARERVGAIANLLIAGYRDGLLQATEQSRFMARILTDSLQDFIETLVGWMRSQYQFDPVEVELPFGYSTPAWQVDLGDGFALAIHGRIDRVDLCRPNGQSEALCLIVDYKSNVKKLDPVLIAHGIQLQLLTYLNVLRDWPNPSQLFQSQTLTPVGVFYVNLRGRYEPGENRIDALSTIDDDRKKAYRHFGRFDLAALPMLDARPGVNKGDQFNFQLTQGGDLNKNSREALPKEAFAALLNRTEDLLKRMGRQILSGVVAVDPYQKAKLTACDQCSYQAICRIDRWTQSFRILKKDGPEAS